MKKFILVLVALAGVVYGFSQNVADTIQIQQKLGKVYLIDGKPTPAKNLYAVLNTNEAAAVKVKQAKSNLFPVYLFAYAGGFMIGWPLGTAIAGGDPNWTLALIGAGLVGLSIPFQVGYNKNMYDAVKIYNSDLQKLGINRTTLELGMNRDGVGIRMRF